MKKYEKPYISDEEIEITDICVDSSTEPGGDGYYSDFPTGGDDE